MMHQKMLLRFLPRSNQRKFLLRFLPLSAFHQMMTSSYSQAGESNQQSMKHLRAPVFWPDCLGVYGQADLGQHHQSLQQLSMACRLHSHLMSAWCAIRPSTLAAADLSATKAMDASAFFAFAPALLNLTSRQLPALTHAPGICLPSSPWKQMASKQHCQLNAYLRLSPPQLPRRSLQQPARPNSHPHSHQHCLRLRLQRLRLQRPDRPDSHLHSHKHRLRLRLPHLRLQRPARPDSHQHSHKHSLKLRLWPSRFHRPAKLHHHWQHCNHYPRLWD